MVDAIGVQEATDVRPAEDRRWRHGVWGASAIFTIVFGAMAVRRQRGFATFVFDFGIFDQGMWLLSRFHDPFVTLRGLNLFADHSSYVMVPLVPIYWLWDDPRALLLVTVAVIALGARFVYAVGRGEGLSSMLAAALAIAYLLSPAVQWQAWDNFHPETLAIPALIGAFALAQRRRFWWAVVVLALVLTVKEDAPLIVIPLGVYLWARWKRRTEGLTIVALAALAAGLNFLVLLPHFSPTGNLLYTDRYARFGTGMLGVAVGVLTRPGALASALVHVDQGVYLGALVLPLAVSLLAPDVLVLAAPITLANMLSSHGYQHEIEYHYTAYAIAVVAVAAAVGLRRFTEWFSHGDRRALAAVVVVVAAISMIVNGPWSTNRHDPWAPQTSSPDRITGLLSMIPADATVSADWNIGPHLAHRRLIYEFPAPFDQPESAWGAPGVPLPPADTVGWVAVLKPGQRDVRVRRQLDLLRSDPDYQVIVDDDELALLRRR